MKAFLEVLRDIGRLGARVAFGIVLVLHGWWRWTSGMETQVARLNDLAVPQPVLVAWGALLLEVGGGILLIFGAFTPVVAAFVLAQHVALVVLKWTHGPRLESGGFEYNLVMAALALVLAVYGSGRAGVDVMFRRPKSEEGPRTSRQVDDHAPA